MNIIKTNLYGEKNFNVVSFVAIASSTCINAFGRSKGRYVNITIKTCKNQNDYENALALPTGEAVLITEHGHSNNKSITVNALKIRLKKAISQLKTLFTSEDEIFFSTNTGSVLKDNQSVIKQSIEAIEHNSESDYILNWIAPIYFKKIVPMKISDFENALEELHNPNSDNMLDEFQILQNKYLMQKFIEMMMLEVKYGGNGNYNLDGTIRSAMTWLERRKIYRMFYGKNLKRDIIHVLSDTLRVHADFLEEKSADDKLNEFCSVIEAMKNSSSVPDLYQLFMMADKYSYLFHKLNLI